MTVALHPFWHAGFRPFFTLACASGMVLPVVWALLFAGVVSPPLVSISLLQWHAHEMFFGFGWAVLGGFLLTATKNWVQVRGYHGATLLLLVAAWLLERVGMWCEGWLPPLLFRLSVNIFLPAIVVMLMWTLIRHRGSDSYRDNHFFLLILPAFIIAKNLLLDDRYFALGTSMCMGLFRMAFLVMLERTLTQFMKGVFQVEILRHAALDRCIKLLGLALVLEGLMPPMLAAALSLSLALLLALRFAFWKPRLALSRIDIGIMYLGYLAIVAQLLVHAADRAEVSAWIGSVSIHIFTFGVMGFIIPAMLVRISRGHTGRKVVFELADKLALWLMLLAFVLRVIAPQLLPAGYSYWVNLAAACWCACFALLGWRYIPWLLLPRVDGKLH